MSWNNTNAEHFIKPFARHRMTANGIFTEHSIQDYLVILSIAETCNGKGRDFLEFLLSDNKHRLSFRSGRHAIIKRRKLAAASAGVIRAGMTTEDEGLRLPEWGFPDSSLTLLSRSSTIIVCGRRACTWSIQALDRSAKAVRLVAWPSTASRRDVPV